MTMDLSTKEGRTELLSMIAAATPGPWHHGHFADDDSECDCKSVVSECYAGGICEIDVNNGLRIEDGGNDAPPLEEAKANARLIAVAPTALTSLLLLLDSAHARIERLEAEVTDEEMFASVEGDGWPRPWKDLHRLLTRFLEGRKAP